MDYWGLLEQLSNNPESGLDGSLIPPYFFCENSYHRIDAEMIGEL
jgi:hypothetical protein